MSGSSSKQRRFALFSILLAATLTPYAAAAGQRSAPRMVVVDERETVRDEPPPHGAIGMSTAYRISDGIEGRTMEFRKRVRSEEHTSELQSLMRISYAVFCLKKKKKTKT